LPRLENAFPTVNICRATRKPYQLVEAVRLIFCYSSTVSPNAYGPSARQVHSLRARNGDLVPLCVALSGGYVLRAAAHVAPSRQSGTSFRGNTVSFFSSKRLQVRGNAVHSFLPGLICDIHPKRLIFETLWQPVCTPLISVSPTLGLSLNGEKSE